MKRKLPKSIRKFIHKEKARIRREVFDLEEQRKLINQLYQKFRSALDQRQSSPKAND